MMKLTVLLLATVVIPEVTGFHVMKEVKSAASWRDMKGKITLILQSSSGEKKRRVMEFFSAKDEKGMNRMLMRLVEPPEIRGMAFLFIERESRDDDRYIYLSKLRMVRKIEASGKGGSFLSSDFTYYDIGGVKLEDWNFVLKSQEKIKGLEFYIVEATPARKDVEKDTGYSRIVYRVREDIPLIWSAEYENRAGVRFKKYMLVRWKKTGDNSYLATQFYMENLITGHRSEIIFEDVRLNTGIPLSFFSLRHLRR